uniref:ZP domain-containing protein n=1 Tax=Anopheles coluzzii TaxID=1518534 RepID=A0A8W7PV16_ANOCL
MESSRKTADLDQKISRRSANFYQTTMTCELSDMDRITLAGSSAFQTNDGADYLENNCAEEPTKLCEFKRLSGRILKTVDSVYQDVASVDECRELCLSSPYRCHSYDYGDTGDMVCRLSHHSRATLSDIQDPYLDVPEAATYELSSCYNVSIECRAGDMIAKIRTSKLFDGKVYAKGSPNSCSVDVKSSLEFELRMGYQDIDCNVRQNGLGRYLNDVVIQHHDTIVTSSDLGLAVTCQYDLTNKTVSNDVDLDVTGDIEPALSEEVVVDSPNVVMKITTRDGSEMMRTAEVGDPLALRFEILDPQSPYEIFVRELVAMDGVDSSEITLIDARGCPTDHFIMGPIYKSASSGKILLSHFDAFKFPSSEMVQFRALVTPCMPTCEPVQCDQDDFGGELRSMVSYGRKRRSVNATTSAVLEAVARHRRETTRQAPQDDMLLVQSPTSLIVAGAVFLLGQLAVIAIWTYLWQRRRKQRQFENASMGSSVVPTPTLTGSRADSMCKLYDSGYAGRHF